jgi:DNA-3-methyladenine glycosylase I
MPSPPVRRCWPTDDPQMIAYHDEEWGVPLRGSRPLFAKLTLDGFQAGLSWAIILRKRAAFLEAFDGFDPARVAGYGAARVRRLLADPGIVRNRLKVAATIGNARALLALEEAGIDFDALLWSFVGGRPQVNAWTALAQLPAETAESRAMSRALLGHGFRFVGPTICYAFMQAVGMVNDHLVGCPRHAAVAPARRAPRAR